MYCMRCKRDVYVCVCSDIEERLESLKNNETIAPAVKASLFRRAMNKLTAEAAKKIPFISSNN